MTGETVFTSIQVDPHQEGRALLRRLQYLNFKDNTNAGGRRIRPMFNDHMLELSMTVPQSVAHSDGAVVIQRRDDGATEHIGLELQMVSQPGCLGNN